MNASLFSTVYLAGLISTDHPESLEWRIRAGKELRRDFRVLTPMRDKHDLQETTNDGGLTSLRWPASAIIHRDYQDVIQSDVILAHLELFGSPRPLIGTIFELAWAWQARIPIVGIAHLGNTLMRRHPFVSQAVTVYVPDLETAYSYVRYFAR